MFGHEVFYHSLIRKYVIVVGTLFNDIYIKRTDPALDEQTVALIKVPVQFAPKDKMLARLDSDPDANRATPVLSLPRIAFELTNMYYDPTRHLNSTGFTAQKDTSTPNTFSHQYNPVPWNFNFVVSIVAKNASDAAKIVEQIIPFFKPEWFVSVELIDSTNRFYDIPIILESVMPEDIYEGAFEQRRAYIWNLNLTVKGYLFGPVVKKPYIKFANTSFVIAHGNNAVNTAVNNTNFTTISSVTVAPGLDANGAATSNSSLSISRDLITIDDDYGFIVEQTFNG